MRCHQSICARQPFQYCWVWAVRWVATHRTVRRCYAVSSRVPKCHQSNRKNHNMHRQRNAIKASANFVRLFHVRFPAAWAAKLSTITNCRRATKAMAPPNSDLRCRPTSRFHTMRLRTSSPNTDRVSINFRIWDSTKRPRKRRKFNFPFSTCKRFSR